MALLTNTGDLLDYSSIETLVRVNILLLLYMYALYVSELGNRLTGNLCVLEKSDAFASSANLPSWQNVNHLSPVKAFNSVSVAMTNVKFNWVTDFGLYQPSLFELSTYSKLFFWPRSELLFNTQH